MGLTGAQAFVRCLESEGLEFVFGVPGGQTLWVMDVLYDRPRIRFVTTRHECAAARLGDADGRIIGVGGAHGIPGPRSSSPATI